MPVSGQEIAKPFELKEFIRRRVWELVFAGDGLQGKERKAGAEGWRVDRDDRSGLASISPDRFIRVQTATRRLLFRMDPQRFRQLVDWMGRDWVLNLEVKQRFWSCVAWGGFSAYRAVVALVRDASAAEPLSVTVPSALVLWGLAALLHFNKSAGSLRITSRVLGAFTVWLVVDAMFFASGVTTVLRLFRPVIIAALAIRAARALRLVRFAKSCQGASESLPRPPSD